jgi:ribosomal protein S18 acetylase RimI-like enzyme
MSRRQLRHHLTNPCARIWVCDAPDSGIAAALVAFFHAGRPPRIYSIATHKAWRGRGHAGRLIEIFVKEARRARHKKVMLEVRQDAPEVIRFYEGKGFRKARPLPGYYEDGTDGWKMIKELD